MSLALQVVGGGDQTTAIWIGIGGYALVGVLVAALMALVYRAVTTRRLPVGTTVVAGSAVVGAWLTNQALLENPLVGTVPRFDRATALFLIGTFVGVGLGSVLGHRLGDRAAREATSVAVVDAPDAVAEKLRAARTVTSVDLPPDAVAEKLRAARTVTSVDLPATVEQATGYRPVDEGVAAAIAERTVRVPAGLDDDAVADRIERRLAADFDLDFVAAAVADGDVTDLTVGRRPLGLGPGLPPGTIAAAVDADPAPSTARGDPVEIWDGEGPHAQLVTTGTVHAATDDVVTVTVEPNDLDALAAGDSYRLTTRSTSADDSHDFVGTVRAADETVTPRTVTAGGPLEGEFAAWLPATVLAIERDGDAIAFPADRETLQAGDTAYVLGTPADVDALERYESTRDEATAAD